MKKVKIFLLFILISGMAFGQKGAKDYFERANDYYYQDKLEKALENYQYIVKHYPRNKLYPSALYNAAHCSFRLERYDQSAGYCRELLGSKVNDREWVGGSIMSNPYANYRHRAARILSDCFFEQQQWDSAYHYLALSDTVYPLISMCGNASAENRIALVVRYAEIYEKMQQPDRAIAKLLPYVFNNILADNSRVIAELQKLLSGRSELKQELDAAIDSIYLKTIVSDHGIPEKQCGCLIFMGTEIELPLWWGAVRDGEFNHDEAATKIKESDFYKMIQQL